MQVILDHIVLNMEDEEKMIAFYTRVIGLAAERLEAYHTGQAPFPSVRLNADTIIDLFPRAFWQKGGTSVSGSGPLNHFCLAMQKSAWESLVSRLEANRVPIQEGPVPRWGAHGTGVSIYFRDPEDNLIEARYYEGVTTSEPCLLTS